jgi:uncharacterized protein (UPF0210 family)
MIPRAFTFFVGKDDLYSGHSGLMDKLVVASAALDAAAGSSRTKRLTLPEISLSSPEDLDVDISIACHWYDRALKSGIRWINQPFRVSRGAQGVDGYLIPVVADLLHKKDRLFASINVQEEEAVDLGASVYAQICKSLSRKDAKGFGNFRFGAGFNINPHTPFFPFSAGDKTGFSVALESLPLIRESWLRTRDLKCVAEDLVRELRDATTKFEAVSSECGIEFHGADWSLAPLPNCDESVVELVEKIAGNPLGRGGSLSAVADLTACLKRPIAEGVKAVGFNGVMLSVLEDDTLASRFANRLVGVNDLLLYSSVCGCGLDMMPIVGDTPVRNLAAYTRDTGKMAFRLKKPLGVRMLPIDRMKEGQETKFSHDFVNNSAVVEL